MMESDNFLFNKPLHIVAILVKELQFLISLTFESICCQSLDLESTESTTGLNLSKRAQIESADFLWTKR